MNNFLPGMEPDFEIRKELNFIGGVLDMRQFDKIFISVSGGKDSHAMLFLVKEIAEKQGALDRLIAMYADTGMEWHNAETHVRKICAAAGIPLKIVYPVRPMIEKFAFRFEQIAKNRKDIISVGFPTSKCRYCTSDQKVAPMNKFMRSYGNINKPAVLLKITGERWNESEHRSHLAEFCKIESISTTFRKVYGWRPMLAFSTEDVFAMIRESGVERHSCYDLGCSRLGCAGCIFSRGQDLKIEMRENPEIFEALDKMEIDSGYTISMDGKLLRDRIK